MRIVIKNGRVINPGSETDQVVDILIENGIIKKIGEINIEADMKVIEAKGYVVVPGLIDVHVHLRDPGFLYKEDIKTGTESAVAGGFTTVCCMPNTDPVIDSSEVVNYIINKSEEKALCHVIPVGAITISQEGEVLAPFEAMVRSGAGAISEDGRSVLSARLLKEAMEEAKKLDIPVLSHCEDDSLSEGGCMNEGVRSKELGLKGIHNDSEDVIAARDILLAKSTGARLHLCHVSTKESVSLIRKAKEEGVRVTAEVCPHHFTLTEDSVDGIDTNSKMNPPLRTKEDVKALLEGISDGTLDIIATDHAPHSKEDKSGGYVKAANGIVGFETAFCLSYSELVQKDVMTLMELIRHMSYNPAQMLGIDKGDLALGKVADITIIDPKSVYTINKELFKTKGRNTPFDGRKVTGKVLYTIVDGVIKYEANK